MNAQSPGAENGAIDPVEPVGLCHDHNIFQPSQTIQLHEKLRYDTLGSACALTWLALWRERIQLLDEQNAWSHLPRRREDPVHRFLGFPKPSAEDLVSLENNEVGLSSQMPMP